MKKLIMLCAVAVFTLGFFSQANAAKVSAKEKNTKAMIEAIKNDNVADVIKYVKAGADVNARITIEDSSFTPLHYAAGRHYEDLAKLLLSKGADVNAETDNKYGRKETPLTIAVEAQYNKADGMVKFFLENGANANYNGLPLFYAIQYGGLDTVKALVEGGADINLSSIFNATPLHVATYYSKKDIVEYLVSKGADVNALDKDGLTPFHIAIDNYAGILKEDSAELKQAKKEIFEILLPKVDNIDMPNAIVSPLYLAALSYGDNKGIMEILLAKGADVNRENDEFGTPVYVAKNKETVEFLVSKGAEIKYLRPAIILGDLKLVKKLVKEGDDVNRKGEETPLVLALEEKHDKIAKYLISKGADVNLFSSYGSPLSMAVYKDNAKMVKYLIAKGAEVNKQGKYNSPALFYANNKKMAEILVKNGADVNLVNANETSKTTALFYAAGRDLELVKYLVSQGANINPDTHFQPLENAVSEDKKDIVEYLIENGANYDVKDPELLQAAISRNKNKNDVAKFLIAKGFDIHAKDKYGSNALFAAVSAANKEMVELLLDNGAEINVQNNYGKTPLDIAWTEDIKQLLISRGAKNGKDLK